MTLQANSAGVIAGKFTIPDGLPAGSKRVSLVGSGGSKGDAVFVGSGTITDEVRRQVTTQTTTLWVQRVDPLAQTFTLPESCQVAAIDLWFAALGTSPIVVQLRETSNGVPTRDVIGEARLSPSGISTTSHTRIAFPAPVQLAANTEYAIVVMCNDAMAELRMAELGKWDSANNRWVTAQPYQVGVLLSSSNASTWTPHQDRDLAFRIHKAVYTESIKPVALGTVVVADATDLMLLSVEETPSADTRIVYSLAVPGGAVYSVSSGQPVRLPAPVTGNVTVTATLYGSANSSPVLLPGTQLVVGTVAQTADYVTRAIPAGQNVRVKAVYEALVPSGSSVSVEYEGIDSGDAWAAIPMTGTANSDDGWMEFTHEVTGVDETMVHAKITLTGTTAARPRVRNLRVMVL